MRRIVLFAAIAALGACQKADNEPGPGGVTMGEARALDDAAQMLDKRRPPAELLQPSDALLPQQNEATEAGAPQ